MPNSPIEPLPDAPGPLVFAGSELTSSHQSALPGRPDDTIHPSNAPRIDPAQLYNARLGLVLFFVYFSMYALFVGLIVYDYRIMARPVLAGVNLAIVYGMGLILSAIVLAVVYAMLCRRENEHYRGGAQNAEKS